jgi:hypothetical protein
LLELQRVTEPVDYIFHKAVGWSGDGTQDNGQN